MVMPSLRQVIEAAADSLSLSVRRYGAAGLYPDALLFHPAKSCNPEE
jgi:hypothetical protein